MCGRLYILLNSCHVVLKSLLDQTGHIDILLGTWCELLLLGVLRFPVEVVNCRVNLFRLNSLDLFLGLNHLLPDHFLEDFFAILGVICELGLVETAFDFLLEVSLQVITSL